MNIFLFIGIVFILTLVLGKYFEKFRVPWIFAALIIGTILAVYNPFADIIKSQTFEIFAQLGMYLLLFLVGFELNISKLRQKSGFILKSTFFIILLEGVIGSLIVHFIFGYEWIISLFVALSFATVGEAILVPILQEFKLINTSLGQSIIGIGTTDDIIEIILLILIMFFVGVEGASGNIFIILGSLTLLFVLTFLFFLFSRERKLFKFGSIESLFLFVLFTFFIFIGIGLYAHAAPLGALLAGIVVRLVIKNDHLRFIENEIKSLTYGFFAPLFFLWVGVSLDIGYLIAAPILIILVTTVSIGAKLVGSYVAGRKELGGKGSVLLGIGLSVRFSTSIIIIKILFDNNIIGSDIYSVVVSSSIIFVLIVPILFSRLALRWKFIPENL